MKKAERPNRVQLAALTRPAAESGSGPRSHISARTRKGIELIPLDQVIYFIADHKYVTLRHEGGEVLLDEPLKALEDEFGDRFVRIHRNALVARERIERLQRTPAGAFPAVPQRAQWRCTDRQPPPRRRSPQNDAAALALGRSGASAPRPIHGTGRIRIHVFFGWPAGRLPHAPLRHCRLIDRLGV